MASRIVELSTIIADNTRIVDEYFIRSGIPTPSFDITGPTSITISKAEEKVSAAHIAVLDATTELNQLMSGPTSMLMRTSANDCLSLQAIYRYRIADAVPVGEERSFEDISSSVGLNVIDLRRILRHAMCNSIFIEPSSGVVAHTAASKMLAENKLIRDFVGIQTEERFPATARTLDALMKYDGAHDPRETGFSLAHNTEKGLYDELANDPIRHQRFAGAMNAFASLLPLDSLLSTFPWGSFGKATVVDVGGAWGPVSTGIAKRFPELRFVVQDLPHVVAEGPSHIPNDLRDRIEFMSYSALDPQPLHGAAIYFFRAVFHNWPDEYCVKILRNQISALKQGARIVISDTCLHEPNTLTRTNERRRRSMDLSMLTYFGSRERTVEDWRTIIKEADPRFDIRGITKPPKDMNHIIDIEWPAS